jgi:hypothetical protein
MSFYSLESILRIEKKRGYTFRYCNSVLNHLKELSSEIGAPVQKVSNKSVGSTWENARKPFIPPLTQQQQQQQQQKSFAKKIVPTELKRKDDKTILNETVVEVRNVLNKLTSKTYLDCVSELVKMLQTFERYRRSGLVDDIIMNKLSEIIFHIATHNRFYSKLYADLFSELIFQFDFLKDILEKHGKGIISKFTTIGEYIDEENYEGFCKMNEENDNLKSLAEFFVNLNKNNIISDNMIQDISISILQEIMLFVNQEDKKYQVDIMADILAILYDKDKMKSSTFEFATEEMCFNKCIKKFSKAKSSDFKCLSKKTIFKFMDMYEKKS